MPNSCLVVDLNNVVIRAYSGMMKADLRSSDGTPTGGLLSAIKTLNGYIQKLDSTHVSCFWDYGKSTYRTSIRPEYKGDRPKSTYLEPGEIQTTFQLFEEYLDLVGIFHYKEQGIEADDLIGHCVSTFKTELPITVLSADHDLRQLVSQSNPYPVTVVKPSMSSSKPNSSTYTYESVVEEYGLPPHRLAEIWAIQGDVGDNIIGVRGYGPAKSLKVIREYGDLWKAVSSHEKFWDLERTIFDNYKLIKLPSGIEPSVSPDLSQLRFDQQSIDRESLSKFFKTYELTSLDTRLQEDTLFDLPRTSRVGMGSIL